MQTSHKPVQTDNSSLSLQLEGSSRKKSDIRNNLIDEGILP